MNKTENRESNFELMRIVSMIMIIFGHILVHGKVLDNSSGTVRIILTFLEMILIIHVNSFVIITGYFQCNKRLRVSKILQINNAMWFYKAIIVLIFIFFLNLKISPLETIFALSPFNYSCYWFIGTYLILYLISPMLNIVIDKVNKEQFQKIIICLTIIISLLSTFSNQVLFNNNYGYSISNFILLYFIGAYIYKTANEYSKKNSKVYFNLSSSAKKIIYILVFFMLVIFNLLSLFFAEQIQSYSPLMNYLSQLIIAANYSYGNPLIILQSIIYVLWFKEIKIKSKIINKISGCVIGVYLIHDNPYLSKILYTDILGFSPNKSYEMTVISRIFICTIIIFVVCVVIEYIRKKIFKYIYNRKVSEKLRKKYQNYIRLLGFNLNW